MPQHKPLLPAPKTVEEFERQYADRAGLTVDYLHERGRRGAPCDCGDDICQGFQMLHDEDEL